MNKVSSPLTLAMFAKVVSCQSIQRQPTFAEVALKNKRFPGGDLSRATSFVAHCMNPFGAALTEDAMVLLVNVVQFTCKETLSTVSTDKLEKVTY